MKSDNFLYLLICVPIIGTNINNIKSFWLNFNFHHMGVLTDILLYAWNAFHTLFNLII